MTRFYLLVGLLVLTPVLALTGEPVAPAFACSAQFPPIDYELRNAHAVALVKAVGVGGPENAAPPAAPDPRLSMNPNGRGSRIVSLEGIGATLEVEELLAGSMPAQVRVDEQRRESIERGIRALEANPGYVFPCELDFVLFRWTAGARYVVFLTKGADGRWGASVRYQVAGTDVIVGFGGDGHPPLSMSQEVYEAYFGGTPVGEPQEGWYEGMTMREIEGKSAPLTPLLEAIRGIAGGRFPLPPTPVPEEDVREPPPRQEQQGRIMPPVTGDAGLR